MRIMRTVIVAMRRCIVASLAATFWIGCVAAERHAIPLAGEWRLALDPQDVGSRERWYSRDLEGAVTLPGSLAAQRIGDDVTTNTAWTGGINDRSWFEAPQYEKYRRPGNIKIPFWLQPEKVFVGAAWYQRDVDVPESWRGRHIQLKLERPHWETTVWIDDGLAGSQDSLSTAHIYDLSRLLSPGKHRLTIRVDNRMIAEVGINAHSVSDHTQGNWNGIVGEIGLETRAPTWIDEVQVYPDLATKTARVEIRLGNMTGASADGEIELRAATKNSEPPRQAAPVNVPATVRPAGTVVSVNYPLGQDALPWDEFSPTMYRLDVKWRGAEGATDAMSAHFGMREVATQGTNITINGRKIFLRGTLECCIFPLTGHPPTDVESWKRIIRICQAHGLNHIRFHSHCPPEAAFVAADELGFYYQVEVAAWVNQGATIGDGRPIDAWLYEESRKIRRAYGNHPSFLLLAYGNEPGGKHHARWLAEWVNRHKAEDCRRLYTSGSGWPEIPENQFHVTTKPRIQAWGGGLRSRINAKPPETASDYADFIASHPQPVISHEIGQWCVYPNFDEIGKYTGHLKAKNFEVFREGLAANGMGASARDFLMASGKLQALCYKEEIESALRTRGMGGFQLLDLHDFPGQGTALVGVLDPFWDSKGYVTHNEFRQFCGPTVPLLRLPKRIFTTAETLNATIDISHFAAGDLDDCQVRWDLRDNGGASIKAGRFKATVPTGQLSTIGEIAIGLKGIAAPARYRLTVAVDETRGGSAIEVARNGWDVWVYDETESIDVPADVHVARSLDAEALAKLDAGGKVLLLVPPNRIRGDALGPVKIGFSPIFWNTAWTKRQAPHTLGILCDPGHPALADFPTDFHTNWQWWELITRSNPFIMSGLPSDMRPIVQVIDDWVTNRRLGLVFEAKMRKGRVVVCGIDLETDLSSRPVARQMRRSLLAYMGRDAFSPATTLNPDQITSLVREPSKMESAGASIFKCDSEADEYPAANLIDGDPSTFWHTPWTRAVKKYPHEVVIRFERPVSVTTVMLTPRQDQNSGRVAKFGIDASADGSAWNRASQGVFGEDGATVRAQMAPASEIRYLRVVLESPRVAKQNFAALAEIAVE